MFLGLPIGKANSETTGDHHIPNPQVSFAQDVMPIIQSKCALNECHGNRLVPFLVSYKKIKKYAPRIKERITHSTMPMPPVEANKKLTPQEIELILQWIDEGSPEN